MKQFQKTSAIVLSRANYKETDKIVVLFSKELGKVVTRAKGVRSIKSHRVGILEPLNLINTVILDKNILGETKLLNSFSKIKSDLNSMGLGFYLCEVLNKILPEHESQPLIFEWLGETLENLNEESVKNFMVKIFWELGYLPPGDYPQTGVTDFVQKIIERKINSKDLLSRLAQN